ncbi:MAG: YiiX/YebB-like N1pC/P60 family cysteine hydrolase [Alistipes sp.]
MKSLLLYIGIALIVVSCAHNTYSVETGDLLFQVNKSSNLANAITAVTSSRDNLNFSHVAIVVVEKNNCYALEAASEEGVRLTPLSDFLRSSAKIEGRPAVMVARLRANAPIRAAVERAKEYLNQPYDWSYLPHNGKMYCSELVYESYRDSLGNPLFTARPMTFRNAHGETAAFWVAHFASLGEPIPEGVMGTNPGDLSKEPTLEVVYRYYGEHKKHPSTSRQARAEE